ncbi:MAG: C1 family peptidase [Bacteriovoracia bacterium]
MSIFFLLTLFSVSAYAAQIPALVTGNCFAALETQQIQFIDLRPVDMNTLKNVPRKVDLRQYQTPVQSQGKRGACTYFTLLGLVESIIKRSTGRDITLSAEYLAWAAKARLKLRSFEEDSSVVVNAAAFQSFGFMLERDFPFQQSWFDKGFPCEGFRMSDQIPPECFSHHGPGEHLSRRISSGTNFVFKNVRSRVSDIVQSIATGGNPVTLSVLGHKEMWEETYSSGNLRLTKRWKSECVQQPQNCGGHALLIVGYNLDKKTLLIKNSWGEKWGRKGYGTISFDYVEQMSDRILLTGYYDGSTSALTSLWNE